MPETAVDTVSRPGGLTALGAVLVSTRISEHVGALAGGFTARTGGPSGHTDGSPPRPEGVPASPEGGPRTSPPEQAEKWPYVSAAAAGGEAAGACISPESLAYAQAAAAGLVRGGPGGARRARPASSSPRPPSSTNPPSAPRPLPSRGRSLPRARSRPRNIIPKHVRHCYNGGARDWWIYTWKKCSPELQTRIPYVCNSWRCQHCTTHRTAAECAADPKACRSCARHDAAVTFARIREATAELDPLGFVFLVLTIDRNGFYSKQPWASAAEAFEALSRMTRDTMRRLRRLTVELGEWDWATRTVKRKNGTFHEQRYKRARLQNQWVAVVEAHRTGWPHQNLLLHSPALAAALAGMQSSAHRASSARSLDWATTFPLGSDEFFRAASRRQAATRPIARKPEGHADLCRCADCRRAVLVRGELAELVTAAGWGLESTAERARSAASVASYVVKLAGDGGKTAGELAKLSQAPTMAPERFRRLRSGVGFLPPRKGTAEGVTGTLIRRERTPAGKVVPKTISQATHQNAQGLETAQGFERAIIAGEPLWLGWNLAAKAAGFPEAAIVVPPVSSWPSSPTRGPPDAGTLAA